MSLRLYGVEYVASRDTDAAYVSAEPLTPEGAAEACSVLRGLGWTATVATSSDDPGRAWVYLGWAGEPEPS